MKNKIIKIKDKIAEMLATRQTIIQLFNDILNYQEKNIILDFEKVEFISRSASDQLYKELKKHEKRIKMINASENVKKMMEIVEKTQYGAKRQLYKVPILEFENKDLSNFLQTI